MRHSRIAITAILLVAASAGASAQTIRHEGSISLPAGVSVAAPAAVSPNGSFVAAVCSDNVLRLWALPSGELVHTRDTKADPFTELRFSNDGRLLAMAAQSGATEVWDVSSWKVLQQFAASSAVYFLAISLDNHLLAGATDYDTEIWNLPTQRRLAVLHAPFDCYCLNSLAFSPDGAMLASADGDTASASTMPTREFCVPLQPICCLNLSLWISLPTGSLSWSVVRPSDLRDRPDER